nr:thiamine phosphate synthase [Hymenobacter negativus]
MLTNLLDAGLPSLHLRKPGWPAAQVETLIRAIPTPFHKRLVLHEHPELVRQYHLGGLHLTGAQRAATGPRPSLRSGQTLSTSLHSLAEIRRHRRRYDYVFLSPIFNSISKQGYASGFQLPEVQKCLELLATRVGYCPHVLALGGVAAENIGLLPSAGFAGAAVLGTIWQSIDPVAAWRQLTAQTL